MNANTDEVAGTSGSGGPCMSMPYKEGNTDSLLDRYQEFVETTQSIIAATNIPGETDSIADQKCMAVDQLRSVQQSAKLKIAELTGVEDTAEETEKKIRAATKIPKLRMEGVSNYPLERPKVVSAVRKYLRFLWKKESAPTQADVQSIMDIIKELFPDRKEDYEFVEGLTTEIAEDSRRTLQSYRTKEFQERLKTLMEDPDENDLGSEPKLSTEPEHGMTGAKDLTEATDYLRTQFIKEWNERDEKNTLDSEDPTEGEEDTDDDESDMTEEEDEDGELSEDAGDDDDDDDDKSIIAVSDDEKMLIPVPAPKRPKVLMDSKPDIEEITISDDDD